MARALCKWIPMAAVGVALLVAGCAGGLSTRGGGWIDVETRHILLRTDVAREDAKALAEEWQSHRDALAATAFSCAGDPEIEPISVTLFSSGDEYWEFGPRDSDVFVEASKPGLAEVPRQILMRATDDTAVLRQSVLHQVAYGLIAQCYPQLPAWLNEGLSLFYETIRLEERQVIAGHQRYSFVPQNELAADRSRRREAITVVPHNAVPALGSLLTFEFDEFYQYTGLLDTLRDRDQLLLVGRYAGAWALTHALQTADPSTRARLEQFMIDVRFGESTMAESWAGTMQGVDLEQLYDDWTAIQIRYPTIALAYTPERAAAPRVRAVDDSDLALHMAARWDWRTEKGRARASEALARAIEVEPDNAEAYLLAAALADASGDVDGAASALEQAIQADPDDRYVVRAQLIFVLGHPDLPLSDSRTPAQLADLLEASAATAPEFDALARYAVQVEGAVMDGRYWAARALRRDPTCAECRVTAGDILLEAGQPVLAASMYRRALNLAAHDAGFDRDAVLEAIAKAEGAQSATSN
ncbi:MAG: tetratricopeptide repeat protein [Myxococcota bacterium]